MGGPRPAATGWEPHGRDPYGGPSGPRRGERGSGGSRKNVPPVPHHGGIPSPWRPDRNRTAIVWRRGPVPGLSPPRGTRGGTLGRRQCPGRGLGVGGPRWCRASARGKGCGGRAGVVPHACVRPTGSGWTAAGLGAWGGPALPPVTAAPRPSSVTGMQSGMWGGDGGRDAGFRQGCGMQAGMWGRDGDRDVGCAMRDAGRDVGQGCGARIKDAGRADDRAGDSEAGATGTSTRGRA